MIRGSFTFTVEAGISGRSRPAWHRIRRIPARFGWCVFTEGQRIIVGAPDAANIGAVFIFEYDGSDWVQTAALSAFDGQTSDHFGWSLDSDADRIVVGARGCDLPVHDLGAAYVFVDAGGGWELEQELSPDPFDPGVWGQHHFGVTVGIYGDSILVGSANGVFGTYSGAVHPFDFDGTSWIAGPKIHPVSGAAFDRFGDSLSLDGNRGIIGSAAGQQLYAIERESGEWGPIDLIVPASSTLHYQYGDWLELDGDRLLYSDAFLDFWMSSTCTSTPVTGNSSRRFRYRAKLPG